MDKRPGNCCLYSESPKPMQRRCSWAGGADIFASQIVSFFKPFEVSYRNKQYYSAFHGSVFKNILCLCSAASSGFKSVGSQIRQQIILYALVWICIFVLRCLEKQTSFHVAHKHMLLFNYICHWRFLSMFCSLLFSPHGSVSKREVLWTGWRWSVWVTT